MPTVDVRDMKFQQQRQDTIDTWMQQQPIEELERKILKAYRGVIVGWKTPSDSFEMNMSLDSNALCAIVCTRRGEVHGVIEYEAIVTWPRDKRKEYWQLEYRGTGNSVYGFDYVEVRSREVAVTPDDDRHILATYFPKMQAAKDILSIYFRDETFHMQCVWGGRILCTLDGREEDISSPDAEAAIRGATVADERHMLGQQENLYVYKLVVKWGPDQPGESWTLIVSWIGFQPKTVIEFKYNGPSSPVTGVKEDPELNAQGCKIADLLQRLGAMTTV
jgi:hypothetical protein